MLKFITILFTAMFVFSSSAVPGFSAQTSAKRVIKQSTTANTTTYRTTLKRAKRFEGAPGTIASNQTQKWECKQTDKGFGGCECKGMLDCKKLIDSGMCKGKNWWEATKDPSIGGCD